MQKQSPGGKKGVLKNFAKLTGKHQYQIPLFNKIVGLCPAKRDSDTGVFP